jgi:peroxiredoxin
MSKLSRGDTFPDFPFHTAGAEDLRTHAVIAKAKKTVFWVLRYVGCTSCRYDIHVIKERYKEFTALGVQILVVLQSPPETIAADLKGDEVPYKIIADPEQRFYKRFSIEAADSKEDLRPKDPILAAKFQTKVDQIKASGFTHGKYEGDELQLPALFIVDADNSVSYAHYAANIADLPTVDELLNIVKS